MEHLEVIFVLYESTMALEGEETIFLKRFSRAEIKAATHCTIHNTAEIGRAHV